VAVVNADPARKLLVPALQGSRWHADGMARTQLSTPVDAELLETARGLCSGMTDAALVDEALEALLARHRSAEIDAGYAAYDEYPIDGPDTWGDLASFRRAAAAS
jgi:antitoxin MazE5